MNGKDFVVDAILKELKARLFDELYVAIEKHQWKVSEDPGDAEYADDRLYDVYHQVKAQIAEAKS